MQRIEKAKEQEVTELREKLDASQGDVRAHLKVKDDKITEVGQGRRLPRQYDAFAPEHYSLGCDACAPKRGNFDAVALPFAILFSGSVAKLTKTFVLGRRSWMSWPASTPCTPRPRASWRCPRRTSRS